MDNKTITLAALGLGAYLLLSKGSGSGSGSNERKFTLPNGQVVNESQLPSYGYIRYNGQWYHQTQFQAPAGTDTSSSQWYNTLLNLLQTGQQLVVLGGDLSTSFVKSIKSTSVDWNNSNVSVNIKFGYQSYVGVVNPTTILNKTYSDQKIQITTDGQQSKISLIKGTQVLKEATIDFYNEKLIGFDAGSVGITGVYIGSVYDYSHPKAVSHCFDGTYSDSGKGACSYHGGVHEVKLNRGGKRVYSGKGKYSHYVPYRKKYKKDWAKSKNKEFITL